MNISSNRRDSIRLTAQKRAEAKSEADLSLRPGVRTQELPSRICYRDGDVIGHRGEAALFFEDLRKTVMPLREKLLKHPVYAQVDSLAHLREFMRIHVFAVWDFMSLAKRLQHEVTVTHLPWTPPARSDVARFANEVVLGEETDLGPDGNPISHFELYLRAMNDVGAGTADVWSFIARLQQGEKWETVLKGPHFPAVVAEFVSDTLRCATSGSVVEVASYFFFGREDVVPEMFQKLLNLWSDGAREVPNFAFYLKRHIELDGDSHGPLAREMLIALAGENEDKWLEATIASQRALISRLKLWDGVAAHLKTVR